MRILLACLGLLLAVCAPAFGQTVGQGSQGDPASPWFVTGTVTANAGSGTFTVGAVNLDVRDLVFATDKVDVSGSSVNQGTPAATANRWPVQLTDGTDLSLVTAGGSLLVECTAGCGGAAAFADNSAFTFGTTSIANLGFVFDDVAPNAVTENNAATPRMSGNRVPYSILRDAAGNERGANVNASNELLVSAAVPGNVTVVQPTGTNLHVVCDSGCTPGGSFADNAAFTFGTTAINVSGFVFDDTAPNTATENSAAAPRMSGNRIPYAILRDAAGNERGANVNASNELLVNATQSGTWNIGTVTTVTGATITALPNEGQQTMANSISVAIASDQSAVPISSAALTSLDTKTPSWSTSNTASTTLDTNGETVTVTVDGFNGAGIHFTGAAAFSGTIQSEASADGVTWSSIYAVNQGYGAPTFTPSGSSNGFWQVVGVNGMRQYRLRVSAYTSGSIVATVVASNVQNDRIPGVALHTVSALNTAGSSVFMAVGGADSTGLAAPITLQTTQPGASDSGVVTRVAGSVSTKTALTYNAPTACSVGVASAQCLASNANRRGLIAVNTSNATISCSVAQTAVLNSGVTLEAGAAWNMNEYSFATGALNCIASSGTSNLSLQEIQQ